MGRARYVSGGEEGRYVIEIDQGSVEKENNLSLLNRRISQLDTNIALQQAENAQGQAIVNQIRAAYSAAVDQYIAELNATRGDPEAELPPSDRLTEILGVLREAEGQLGVAEAKLAAWKLEREECRRQVAYWNGFTAVETRPAWCVDYTEEAAGEAGADLQTIELEGEPNLILVGPGALPALDADGYLFAREAQRGHQVFYNAAILPGWQKWKPTYRSGVITGINFEVETCTVALDDARSTAQSLNINQSATLEEVPIVYMDCNAQAFEIDDRVVVEFQGQDWAQPRVIGFVDTPKQCGPFRPNGYYLAESYKLFEEAPLSRSTFMNTLVPNQWAFQVVQNARFESGNLYTWKLNGQTMPLFDFGTGFARWRIYGYGIDSESTAVLKEISIFTGSGSACPGFHSCYFYTSQQESNGVLRLEVIKNEDGRTVADFTVTMPIMGQQDSRTDDFLTSCVAFPYPGQGNAVVNVRAGFVGRTEVPWVEIIKA